MAVGKLHTNRLIKEKSPYLLQHAHNPVDWYPWGQEAFDAAKLQDKPIFLSIGYATCHWCHVMEKESFENAEVAQLMNSTFISIKVDREELPEVDSLYMEFAQSMMSGAAGWPLNVLLTPDLCPFFAITYLPPHRNHGMMGLAELIQRIHKIWNGGEREHIVEQSVKIVEAFAESAVLKGEELPLKDQVEEAGEIFFRLSDPLYGGMKSLPKFPIGYQSNFLLRYYLMVKDARALYLVEKTLEMMHRGGIYDHLGGGFSRYSVDAQWLIPHFEKMLYDNALLASSYLEAWKITKNTHFSTVCKEILNYIVRDMTGASGGYYSAEDADSEDHEGFFYTWTKEEIANILGKDESQLFCEFYDISEKGNFEGRNVLNTKLSIEEFARNKGKQEEDLSKLFQVQKHVLWSTRERREHPLKDDKVLSSWNGLMIHSMAEAGAAFQEKKYTESALKAAQFIRNKMWQKEYLFRRWREGEALFIGGIDEYAFLIRGLITLFETDQGAEWLEWAIAMANILTLKFKSEGGGFFQTDGADPNIILRKCQFADGAEPSGNAIHCENLLRLYQITWNEAYLKQAEDVLRAVKVFIDNYPPGYAYHLINLIRYYNTKKSTMIIALNESEDYYQNLQELLYHSSNCFFKSIIWRRKNDQKLFEILPFVKEYDCANGETTLYICQQGVCQKPLTEFNQMREAIQDN